MTTTSSVLVCVIVADCGLCVYLWVYVLAVEYEYESTSVCVCVYEGSQAPTVGG